MMSGRYAKGIPKFIYFIGSGEDWVMGPYVKPQRGHINRKFILVEVEKEDKTHKRSATSLIPLTSSKE
jgi:hypothetical protein